MKLMVEECSILHCGWSIELHDIRYCFRNMIHGTNVDYVNGDNDKHVGSDDEEHNGWNNMTHNQHSLVRMHD